LDNIYDPKNLYLVHLDQKNLDSKENFEKLADEIWYKQNLSDGSDVNNIVLMKNSIFVTWGGFSLLLTSLYGMALSLEYRYKYKWDFWINISPSDMPLFPQNELLELLNDSKNSKLSYISGQRYNWFNSERHFDRREAFFEDFNVYNAEYEPSKKKISGAVGFFRQKFIAQKKGANCLRNLQKRILGHFALGNGRIYYFVD